MWIEKTGIENFRNFKYQSVDFCNGVNIIYGDNAQGKTNLMEALWLLTGFHSFRTRKSAELILFGEKNALIKSHFHDSYGENLTEIKLEQSSKKIIFNGEEYNSRSYYIGKFQAVLFSPVTMNLINGSPQERRRFIDVAMSALYPKYSCNIVRYNAIIKQRNSVLKNYELSPKDNDILLDYYDEVLAETGTLLTVMKRNYISKIKNYAYDAYASISDNKDILKLHYCSQVCNGDEDEKDIKEFFLQRLQKSRGIDIEKKMTNIGPHRDDIAFYINSKSAKIFASQGQRRSAALAVKFAEAVISEDETKEVPIIMLDDVMSELDQQRQHDLFKNLKNCQTFITCCDKDQVKRFTEGKYFEIKNGEIFY